MIILNTLFVRIKRVSQPGVIAQHGYFEPFVACLHCVAKREEAVYDEIKYEASLMSRRGARTAEKTKGLNELIIRVCSCWVTGAAPPPPAIDWARSQ